MGFQRDIVPLAESRGRAFDRGLEAKPPIIFRRTHVNIVQKLPLFWRISKFILT